MGLGEEGNKNETSLYSPSVPQGKGNKIKKNKFEGPSVKKKKSHQQLMGFMHPQEG